jgi:hypothetical protein
VTEGTETTPRAAYRESSRVNTRPTDFRRSIGPFRPWRSAKRPVHLEASNMIAAVDVDAFAGAKCERI